MADRISELSDHILSHILSFLPTKVAATTSILSKRWKHVWHSVHTIDFNDETFKDFHSLTSFMSSTMSSRDIKLPIHSLTFKCVKESSPYDLKVLNQFVISAIEQGKLENLSLRMPLHWIVKLDENLNKIHLSPCVFSCRTLQVLNLSFLILKDITLQSLDLPLLQTLRWNFVVFKNINHVIQLLSSCPILEELHANHSFFQQYTIPAEHNLKALPNLAKASMCGNWYPITMLTLLSRAKNLHLQTNGIKIHYTWLPMFYNLTSIELIYSTQGGTVPEISKLVWWLQFLKRCPKLQNVTIQDCDAGDQSDIFDKYLKDEPIVPPCLSSQLKTFCLRGFKGTENELKFLKYIINNSEVLQTVTISSTLSVVAFKKKYCTIYKKEINQMLKKLSSSTTTRGITTCRFLFD
ncbi:hypothetical protein P8452_19392 [Trifolium repens]|nr:hypothetical protein P8452_19392 [Trifolium repens]